MLSFFSRDVLDGTLDLIKSVSEGLPTYSCLFCSSDFIVIIVQKK